MTLARVWTRHLYGASVVAVLAPVTMIVVLAVLALGGGFGGLSALGQLVSGPAVPVSSTPTGGRVASHAATPVLPVLPPSTPAPRARVHAPATLTAGAGAGTTGTRGGGSPSGGGSAQRVASGGHGVTPPATLPPSTPTQPAPPVGAPTPTPTPTPAPPSLTAPIRAIVNQVVALGVSVTSKLPAPLAAIGTGALESVGQVLNKLLAPQS